MKNKICTLDNKKKTILVIVVIFFIYLFLSYEKYKQIKRKL